MPTSDDAPALTRRTFLTAWGATVIYLAGCRAVLGACGPVTSNDGRVMTNAWIAVTKDSNVLVLVDKCEMGQGVRHMFASIVAEEMGLSPEMVKVEDAPADPELYGNSHFAPTVHGIPLGKLHPFQATGRSSSAADMWAKLRRAAAGTRRLLESRAVEHFKKSIDLIEFKAGRASVPSDPNSSPATLAQLLNGWLPQPQDATPSNNQPAIIGSATAWRPRIDAYGKVTGEACFGIDIGPRHLREDRLPANPFLVAVVLRPSRLGDSIDLDHADMRAQMQAVARMPGVKALVPLSEGRGGLAVVADSFWHADKARRRFRRRERGRDDAVAGSTAILQGYEDELDKRARQLEATSADHTPATADPPPWRTYVTPFGPHAAMEPLSAVCARDKTGTYHIYAATQFPESAQAQAVRAAGGRVVIHGQIAGGAFGRRAASDFIVEVAEICREVCRTMPGAAVKLMWTREDDFRHDYLRPCAASRVRAAVTKGKGKITSWDHLLISESPNLALTEEFLATFPLATVVRWAPRSWLSVNWRPALRPTEKFDVTVEEGLADSVYEMGQCRHLLEVPRLKPAIHDTVRVGYWRSVGCFHTVFAVESMLDELAWDSDTDPLTIRRTNLTRDLQDLDATKRQRRMLCCVDRLAALVGERKLKERGTGYGLACFSGWNSFAALVVRIEEGEQDPREIRVREAWAAVDCGFVLNPDVLHQQVEGGIVFGLSAALKQEVTTMNGAVRETNFHACDSLRIHECPTIQVVHQTHPATDEYAPSGVGELLVPLPAPAVANAVFNLTGRRFRRIPLGRGDDR